MLAMTEMPCREAEDRFASTLRTFHEHARAIAALPRWNDFTVRTAILLSQLGTPARNDDRFAACR